MNNYTIIREVGKGGMGSVYEAKSPNGKRVALKMMSAKAAACPDYREMFDHEVSSLRKLSHPSIVNIVDEPFSDSNGNLYLPMEFIEGNTISQIVQNPAHGPYSEDEAISLFSQLLDVFTYIHRNSCIHRDVKPSNIMIRPDGSVCVIDFGIAKDSKTSTGKTIGKVVGTDGYMSPEQANGLNIDYRTDIYSLGCLLHYMLCGSHAIAKKSNDYETVCAILDNDFPLLSEKGINVSRRTQDAILKAVDKNMLRRFQTTEEFKHAIQSQSYTQSSTEQYVVTVGRSGCDINIPGEYVSKHHLELLFTPGTGSTHVIIRDMSTNGTGVDGKMIKHSSFEFSYGNNTTAFPSVMLAGLADYTLNWQEIIKILFEKRGSPTTPLTPVPPQPPTIIDDKISIGAAIVSFLMPLAGWILGGIWKKKFPRKSKKANKFAWFGFLFNIITIIISKL